MFAKKKPEQIMKKQQPQPTKVKKKKSGCNCGKNSSFSR